MTKSEIVTISDFSKLKERLLEGDEKSLTLLDIDDTIIVPKSHMFRPSSKHYHFIDKIKANMQSIPNYAEILSVWRLNREIILVNNNWPAFVKERKNMGYNIYALTQMRPGEFGRIKSMEDWRYNELKSIGVEFVEEFQGQDNIEVLPETAFKEMSGLLSAAVFHKGFFMTGGHSKGSVARYILEENYPSKVFFVDDREDHVKDVGRICQEFNIPYFGAIYRGVDLLSCKTPSNVHDLQEKMLMEELRWVEDEEAEEMVRNGWE